MPFARLTLSALPTDDIRAALAASLTRLIADDLRKRRDVTSVLIETPGTAHWTIGEARRAMAAHLEVCVTRGTNREEEKRAFVGHAMALLRQTFPDLAPATYVVIKEIDATDWGYDGLTQADRASRAA